MPFISESGIQQVMAYWCTLHKDKLKAPYMIQWGKDQKIMKEIIGTYGQAPTMAMVDHFFKKIDTDEFLKKTGASVGIFKTQVPKLILMINETEDKSQIGKL